MRTMRYDDEEYVVCETAEELISMLKEGDEIMSNKRWEGDESSYYCGSVPTYTYGEGGEKLMREEGFPIRADVKDFKRNAEDVKRAIEMFPKLELDVWRDSEGLRFFFNANGEDLTWHFEV